jgi:chitinase
LNRPVLAGYLHDWIDPDFGIPPLVLGDVAPRWDEVIVAFAEVTRGGVVTLPSLPIAASGRDLAAQVELLRAGGKRVAFSIGGANAGLSLDDTTRPSFVASVCGLLDQYHFDGIDFDLESKCDLTQPGNARSVRDAIAEIRAARDVRILFTPEWPAVQGGFMRMAGYWGSHLWLLNELRDVIDSVRVQYYNNADMPTPYSRRPARSGAASQLVDGSRMMMEGFPLASGGWFEGLRPGQVGLAVASSRSAARTGFSEPHEVAAAIDDIRRMSIGRGAPQDVELAVWSINWSALERDEFVSELLRCVTGQ